jgi:hypothetical protein
MRRISLIFMGLAALALCAPGAALARHHHSRHHHHRRHHARLVRFGTRAADTTTGTTTGTTGTGSTDNVGTIASFTNGVLTLTLNDGSTISGKVTDATQIECNSTQAGGTDTGDDSSGDSSDGSSASGSSTTQWSDGGGDQGDDNQGDDQGGDDQGDNGGSAPCDSTALVAGAAVHEAELQIGSGGSVFSHIELA